jgi:hypothetical protein
MAFYYQGKPKRGGAFFIGKEIGGRSVTINLRFSNKCGIFFKCVVQLSQWLCEETLSIAKPNLEVLRPLFGWVLIDHI